MLQAHFGCGSIRPDRSDRTIKWETRRLEYAGNPFLGLLGLGGPVQAARFTAIEDHVQIQLDLSLLQMSRLIRFATPMLVGARRE